MTMFNDEAEFLKNQAPWVDGQEACFLDNNNNNIW